MVGGLFKKLWDSRRLLGWGTAGVGVVGGAAVGGQALLSERGNSWLSQVTDTLMTEFGSGAAAADRKTWKAWLYSMVQMVAEIGEDILGAGGLSTRLKNWALRSQGKTPDADEGTAVGSTKSAARTEGLPIKKASMLPAGTSLTAEFTHKAHLLGHGLAEGGVHIVNLVGHAADAADWTAGKALSKLFNVNTGFADRNISADLHKGMMRGVNSIIGAPDLKSHWDKAIHFGAELAPSLVGGAVLGAPKFVAGALSLTGPDLG